MNNKMKLVCLYESAEQVELAFYYAFGTGDFALMESLYADHHVSYKHLNNPNIVGREKVIANWEFLLESIPITRIDIKTLSISSNKGFEERNVLESFVMNKASGERSEVFATNTYILQENGWRMQRQQTSLFDTVNKEFDSENMARDTLPS